MIRAAARAAPVALALLWACTAPVAASPSDIGGPGISRDHKWKMTLEYKDDANISWVLPKLAYSRPLAARFEGEVALSRMVVEDVQGVRAAGTGDVEFKGKWALRPMEAGSGPGIALEPKLILAAGPRDTGPGVRSAQFELPALVGWQWETLGLYTKAGYRHGLSGRHGDRRYMGGVLGTWQPAGTRLRYGLDLYAEAPWEDRGRYRLHANLGVNWYLSRAIEIQALLGRSVRHPDDLDAYKAKLVIEYKFDGRG